MRERINSRSKKRGQNPRVLLRHSSEIKEGREETAIRVTGLLDDARKPLPPSGSVARKQLKRPAQQVGSAGKRVVRTYMKGSWTWRGTTSPEEGHRPGAAECSTRTMG